VALVGVFALLPLIAAVRWLPYGGNDAPEHLLGFAPEPLTAELREILEPGEPFANPQAWGSWFELTLPDHPVYADSRIEVVPDDVLRSSFTIQRADPGWQEELDAIGMRVLVIDRLTQPDLVDAIGSNDAWREVYADEDGIVLVGEGRDPVERLPPCPPS
jgi:hypothetical protein